MTLEERQIFLSMAKSIAAIAASVSVLNETLPEGDDATTTITNHLNEAKDELSAAIQVLKDNWTENG
jgi:hypothetical protein